jgi:uncharacterized SAM-dependent methyltransferase
LVIIAQADALMQKESHISRYTLFGAFGLALIEIPEHKQSNRQA